MKLQTLLKSFNNNNRIAVFERKDVYEYMTIESFIQRMKNYNMDISMTVKIINNTVYYFERILGVDIEVPIELFKLIKR